MAVIFLRMTEDWANVSLEDLTFYQDKFKILIQMWDNRFSIRYFRYRELIKDIAMRQWPMPFITELPNEINDDEWFVPSDDDDWTNPRLPEFLERQTGEYVYWDSIVNQMCIKYGNHKWFSCHNGIGSNNYALKGSLLRRANDVQLTDLVHNHLRSIEVAKELGAEICEHKDKILSCYNNHPGSISSLHHVFEKHLTIKGVFPVEEYRIQHPKWLDPWQGELLKIVNCNRD